jgi:hypothetical protein
MARHFEVTLSQRVVRTKVGTTEITIENDALDDWDARILAERRARQELENGELELAYDPAEDVDEEPVRARVTKFIPEP